MLPPTDASKVRAENGAPYSQAMTYTVPFHPGQMLAVLAVAKSNNNKDRYVVAQLSDLGLYLRADSRLTGVSLTTLYPDITGIPHGSPITLKILYAAIYPTWGASLREDNPITGFMNKGAVDRVHERKWRIRVGGDVRVLAPCDDDDATGDRLYNAEWVDGAPLIAPMEHPMDSTRSETLADIAGRRGELSNTASKLVSTVGELLSGVNRGALGPTGARPLTVHWAHPHLARFHPPAWKQRDFSVVDFSARLP